MVKPIYPKPIVGAFIFNDRDELLLLKLKQWNNKYSCPGGKVEMGETLEEALVREVKEETGLDIYDIRFMEAVSAVDLKGKYRPGDKHLLFLDYAARAKNPDKVKTDKEASGYKWLKVEDWLENRDKLAHKYLAAALENLRGGFPEDYEGKYRRALADYQNVLKRTAGEKQEFAKYANEQLIAQILPIYDNLRESLKHIDRAAEKNGWAQGIRYIVKQFADFLSENGVSEIKAEGQAFDPRTMEAVEGRGETVKKVLKPGYELRGKVIVPARVVVADKP